MIKKLETTLESQHDGLNLSLSLRVPEHPKGILQLVHGMAEHKERYHEFMDYCAEHGYIVAIHDHRGHGASVKDPNDLGYFYQNGIQGIIDDVHQVTEYLKAEFPQLPLTLFGHSMGSLVVRCYMQKYDSDVDQLVVCGSPSKRFGAGLGKNLARFLQIFRGGHHRSQLVNHLAFSGYNKRSAALARQNGDQVDFTKHYPTLNSWVVSDPAVVEAYDADSRDGFIFTLNGFVVLFGLAQQAYRKSGWQMHNPDAPIFFIAGANDPCIISHHDFAQAVNFMRERGYYDVKSKLYPGMRHEILNETGKQEVWQDVLNFVVQMTSKNSPA